MDMGYCSDECWENSEEYKTNLELIEAFIKTLTPDQKEVFFKIMDMDEYFVFKAMKIIEA